MTKVDLAKYNMLWFYPGPKWKRLLWYFVNVLFFMNPLNPFSRIKVVLLRIFGAKVGKGVIIKPCVNIKYPWKLTIGNYTWIGERVWIDNLAHVSIENNVCISQGAMLLCGNHNYKIQSFDLIVGKIRLEEGVWIGAKSIVCAGVTCKGNSVLSVGSVANSNLEPNAIYKGNPAVKIRDRVIV